MDFRAKQHIIEQISDEVNELHPLLHSFLSKLPQVISCEYTHGPNEKGADFVLTRQDPSLGTISYVGVIAKRGKIVSDISEITKQIEECGIPRFLRGGKEKVRLTEMWVINNNSITVNAKDKIHDYYAKQKIEFIDGEQLTQLVDKYAEHFWHHIPSPLGTYLENLAKRLLMQDRESGVVGNIDCNDFYIEPDIQEIEKISYVRNRRRANAKTINIHEEIRRSNVSFLEAEMGFGKSKTTRQICNFYCSPDRFNQYKIVPIHYSFRLFHEQKLTLEVLLKQELGEAEEYLSSQQATIIVVLDGIDEAATNGTWKTTLRDVISAAKANNSVRLLLTTRPLRVLGEEVDFYSGARRFVLRPLSLSKVTKFIELACSSMAVPKKIYEDLQKSDLFKQLPQSPIAAALLSSLIAQNQHDLPSNLTELYSKSLEYMLGRWDVQKGIAPEKEYQAAERVAMLIADYMVTNKLIWMSFNEAMSMLEEWHSKRNTGVVLESLKTRVFEKSGIFSIDLDTNTLSFRHRSFGEYLYARNARANPSKYSAQVAFESYWVECTFFYIGLLGDCRPLLESLFEYKTTSEAEEWMKVLALPDYILAGYQTEYSLVEDNLYKLFIEAASLYQRVRRGDTKTKLTELPEMHLLWLFQRLIRQCYDYDFLHRSISTTILKIEGENIDSELKFYALFFASCFSAQLGDPAGFEFIIKTYPTEKVPLPISLALKIETQLKKDFSKLPLVKKHDKRLQRLLSSTEFDSTMKRRETSSVNSKLDDLFERPIKNRSMPNN
jgi:hypothetical protein